MIRIVSNDYPANLPGSAGFNSGGTAVFAKWLSNEVISQGNGWCGIVIVRSRGRQVVTEQVQSGRQSYWRVLIPSEIMIGLQSTRRTVDPILWYAEPIAAIADILRHEQTDLVFINGAYSRPWLIAQAARQCGIPIILKHAGIWRQEVLASPGFSARGRAIALLMEQQLSQLATREVFLNQFSWRAYNKLVCRVSPAKGSIIPLPVQLPARPTPMKVTADPMTTPLHVGFVGRWDAVKNFEGYYRIARAARQEKLPWRFSAVVDIPDTGERANLKKHFRSLIDVIPPMPQRELLEWYRQLDVLLVPSTFDVSPHVVLEALAVGTPVIISPTVGYVDHFKQSGAVDWVVKCDNPLVVLRRIERIASQPMPGILRRQLRALHQPTTVSRHYRTLFNRVIRTTIR